jgi:uncharacterized membrane protein YhaH (DUF805 family)
MSIFQEIIGTVCVFAAMGIYHWISTNNAKLESYASRVLPFMSVSLVVFGVITTFIALTGASDESFAAPAMAVLGMTAFIFGLALALHWWNEVQSD